MKTHSLRTAILRGLGILGLLATGFAPKADPVTTPLGWAKLDGRWYAWNSQVDVDLAAITILGSGIEASTCRRPGGGQPRYAEFVIEIGAAQELYYIKTFSVNVAGNYIEMTTTDADATCTGQIAGPPSTPSPVLFASGFE